MWVHLKRKPLNTCTVVGLALHQRDMQPDHHITKKLSTQGVIIMVKSTIDSDTTIVVLKFCIPPYRFSPTLIYVVWIEVFAWTMIFASPSWLSKQNLWLWRGTLGSSSHLLIQNIAFSKVHWRHTIRSRIRQWDSDCFSHIWQDKQSRSNYP